MANVFFDFTAANNGDGTTAAQAGSPGGAGARNTLTGYTPAANDILWLRRGNIVGGLSGWHATGMTLNGWPKSTDEIYGLRPQSGIDAGWDADEADYATQNTTTKAFPDAITSAKIIIRRFKHDGVTTTCSSEWTYAGVTDFRLEHSYIIGLNWESAYGTSKGGIKLTGASSTLGYAIQRLYVENRMVGVFVQFCFYLVTSYNHQGVAGAFRGKTQDASLIAVSNVKRTGTAYSFKYARSGITDYGTGFFTFGGEGPSENAIMVALPSGASTIVLHLGLDIFVADDIRSVIMTGWGLDASGNRIGVAGSKLVATGETGWDTDVTLYTYRLELPVTMGTAGNFSLQYKIGAAVNTGGAAIYFDPTLVVE